MRAERVLTSRAGEVEAAARLQPLPVAIYETDCRHWRPEQACRKLREPVQRRCSGGIPRLEVLDLCEPLVFVLHVNSFFEDEAAPEWLTPGAKLSVFTSV